MIQSPRETSAGRVLVVDDHAAARESIADVLDMSVEEALEFFDKIPKIKRRLQTLHDVGLDYMRLGQSATTLSGGEAQRIKLSSELSKVATGKTLYILDEPTTGLDPVTAGVMNDLIAHIREEMGTASVVVTHDMRTAFGVADRIAMLHQGRILLVDTVEGFRRTTDPIVRAFIEGRASGLDLSNIMTQQWQVPQ